MLLMPLVTKEIEEILTNVMLLLPKNNVIKFVTPVSQGYVQFQLPISKRDIDHNDLMWHSPMFLSTLSAESFYKIFTAMLLEKSLIFVSDNLSLLSSAVMGIQCFA